MKWLRYLRWACLSVYVYIYLYDICVCMYIKIMLIFLNYDKIKSIKNTFFTLVQY